MRRLLVALAGVMLLVAAAPVIALLALVGSTPPPPDQACPASPLAPAPGEVGTVAGLSAAQTVNAAVLVTEGRRLGVPDKGLVVAVAMARQESALLNLPSQAVPESLTYPHDTYPDGSIPAGDHDSVGLAQQRANWGTVAERMDPATAARMFYTGGSAADGTSERGLLDVPGWQAMSVAEAAQAVQVSAFPSAYARWEPLAVEVVAALTDGTVDLGNVVPAGTCQYLPVAFGDVVHPMPPGTYIDRENWGNGGIRWASGHTGTDFSAPCGTPVLAAHGGTVVVETDQPWAGPWLVKVTTGPGQLTTWYAHMQAVTVQPGQTVAAGQPIGETGTLGNSSGCHLHFEVHPTGGSIYADNVNPTVWLAENIGTTVGGAVPAGAPLAEGAEPVATFNLLGHSHTAPGGNRPGWAPSAQRTRAAVDLLERHGVTLAGFQEFQPPQRDAFLTATAGRWRVWHPPGDTANAVAWRTDRWSLVDATTVSVPYFHGDRPMPVVQVQHASGARLWVLSVHNPADARGPAAAKRAEALRRELAVVDRLAAQGFPVLLLGDFNDRGPFYCTVVAAGLTVAQPGGSSRPCRVPRPAYVDWVAGTPDVTFTGWRAVPARGISDHPLIVTGVL